MPHSSPNEPYGAPSGDSPRLEVVQAAPRDEVVLEIHPAADGKSLPTAAGNVPAKLAQQPVPEHLEEASAERGAKEPKVTTVELFRFADSTDKLLMGLGLAGAMVNGCGMPAFSYIFGQLVTQLAEDPSEMGYWAMWMAVAGGVVFFAASVQMAAFTNSGERQADRIRSRYLAALLQQEPGWHDGQKVGTLTSRLHGDTHVIHAGIGEKVGLLAMNTTMIVSSYIIGFIVSWRLTLIMLSTAPLVAAGGALMQWSMTTLSDKAREAYGEAGGVAEEVLSSVRTVYAFNAQEASVERYVDSLQTAKRSGMKRGFVQGAGVGFTIFIMFSTYGIAFYYASWLIEWGLNDVGDILTTFFSVLMGSFAMGSMASPSAALASARAAAFKVFRIIDREPAVASGERQLGALRGEIELRGVSFRYPTRKEHWVFRDLDISIGAGQAVALVGASGCGKSSVVSMLQRFYDPEEGTITVDGVPLTELDLEWWRAQVGIVTQEPVLFSGTIAENVRMGLGAADWSPGDEIPADVMQRIEKACRDAQIHDIITSRFPDGYQTRVGEGGSKLSGGQKQRVAIARAIVKDPRILLLDEATSALDRRHEVEVQRALNEAMKHRTTVIVAHRLTTVRHADQIIVLRPPPRRASVCIPEEPAAGGHARIPASRIQEQGTHEELLARGGLYAQLYRTQMSSERSGDALSPEAEGGRPDRAAAAAGDVTPPGGRREGSTEAGSSEPEGGEKQPKRSAIGRVVGMSRPWWGWAALGVLGSVLNGLVYPGYAVIFTKAVVIFTKEPEDARAEALVWVLLFFGVGVLSFAAYVIELGCFGVAGENLTVRLRSELFRHMLRQDLSFHDQPGHESGTLAAVLAGKAEVIYKLFGPTIGLVFRTVATLAVGFGIAFFVSWELTLVVLAVVPVMAAAGYLNMLVMGGAGLEDAGRESGDAGRVGSEALLNIRTVIAFNLQGFFQSQFNECIEAREKKHLKKATVVGLFYGFSQFVLFASFALALWYGGLMIKDGRMPETDVLNLHDDAFGGVMLVTMAIVLSAMGVGETIGMQGAGMDAGEASEAVFEVLDREPAVDQMCPRADDSAKLGPGLLEFRGVDFTYPTRAGVPVLNSLDLRVAAGKATALIGDTGCGKSTVIQLLLRFYDPAGGAVLVDGVDTRELNLRYWRDQIGLVSQEPVLFSGSIADNIRLGRPDATLEEVQDAARRAHVHDFIEAMPDGYSTLVGQKGSQLSGGQKQRVAIARAVIKRPRVLLLDEATSALDNNSEREVQDALDAVIRAGGMTTVEIAHRMTTIEGADSIAVLAAGQLVEQGAHSELIRLEGDYASRYQLYHSLE